MGIILFAIIIGAIIIGVNWGKAGSANSEDKLEMRLVKSMEETKNENEKNFQLKKYNTILLSSIK
ncbi:hypothetical protein CSE16_19320 [Solibacillus sp. R5-41]|uniref:hypothetical protein n=1 Tax=Solibacillus sp. R5-41 TaxID=2048654 RepID=UPI000C126AB2|nr:hypothetical protein [Solibacillus sp. R5-41]ATP41994.1 hypothetical protein CSE16_19320 [Solibacillus sp. R5-41]